MFHLSRVAKGVISFTSSAYISKILGVSPSEAAVDLLNPHVVVSLTVRNGCRGEACCGGESYGSNWIKGSGDTGESEVFG
ncbi:unnamed protein product, partial [Vitis vinifera]